VRHGSSTLKIVIADITPPANGTATGRIKLSKKSLARSDQYSIRALKLTRDSRRVRS
jgi:hypothetical protein